MYGFFFVPSKISFTKKEGKPHRKCKINTQKNKKGQLYLALDRWRLSFTKKMLFIDLSIPKPRINMDVGFRCLIYGPIIYVSAKKV